LILGFCFSQVRQMQMLERIGGQDLHDFANDNFSVAVEGIHCTKKSTDAGANDGAGLEVMLIQGLQDSKVSETTTTAATKAKYEITISHRIFSWK